MNDDNIDLIIEKFIKAMPLFQKKLLRPQCCDNKQNLTHSHLQIMVILKERGKSPISDVAKRLLISTPNMTKLLNKLIDEELVERFPDKKDRRIINIDLTQKGNDLLSDRFQNLKSTFRNKLSTVSNDQLVKLDFSLTTLLEVLESIRTED
ncbi:MAG: MarR family winged helix-turn-helix transcriptional regulator [Peptostreptococcaceae bacterium]